MTAPNAELAYRVLDHIDAHPEQWRQGVYIGKADCGTAACFAGWACLLSGEEPNYSDFYGLEGAETDVLVSGMVVPGRAEELLGASRYVDEGGDFERDLFDGGNSREDLGLLVAEIFGPRPTLAEQKADAGQPTLAEQKAAAAADREKLLAQLEAADAAKAAVAWNRPSNQEAS